MSKTCTNCDGKGLVGAGDKPWMQEGAIHTCKACNGTGKVEGDEPGESAETPVETAPAGDAPEEPAPTGGIINGIKKLFGN